jgi:hypothetical protein
MKAPQLIRRAGCRAMGWKQSLTPHKIVGTLVITLLLTFCATDAQAATLRLRIESVDTGQGVVITDEGAGDPFIGVDGLVNFTGSLGSFSINVTTGASQPLLGGDELDLNSINLTLTGAGTLRISLEDSGFTFGGPSAAVAVSVGGTLTAPAGSSVTFNAWANPADLVPAYGPDTAGTVALSALGAIPAGSVLGGSFVFGLGAFAGQSSAHFMNSGPFSMFSQADIVFTGAGTVSFDLNVQQAVPEPATVLLLGAGLAAIAWRRRRART